MHENSYLKLPQMSKITGAVLINNNYDLYTRCHYVKVNFGIKITVYNFQSMLFHYKDYSLSLLFCSVQN